ncbi:MAG: ABC transporter permease, partial [Rhodospirillaceae bacterium]|nr:ABC transporter permease [Rhodospirillaceae bacterium]
MTMPAAAHAREAARSLRAAGQRTLLALVGIVVGIGAVIALLTVGGIAKSEARKQFQSLGTDMLSVVDTTRNVNSFKRADMLDATDAADLERLATIRAAAPYTLDSAELALGSQPPRSIRRLGVTAAFRDMYDVQLTAGRFITPFDGRQPFAVLGAGVAKALRESGIAPEAGLRLQLGRGIYTVIGILANAHSSPPGTRLNDSVLIPIELALRNLATKELQGITLRTAPAVHYLAATEEIQSHFRLTAPNLTVRVDSPVPIIEQMEAQMRLFALLLGAVGGISLVVGGFGVMNAMLASVAER